MLTHQTRQVHIHRPFLKALVSQLLTHNIYDTIFEHYFVEQTRAYFFTESRRKVEVEDVSAQQFLSHCRERSNEEDGRAKDVMPGGTVALVRDASIRALYEGRLEWIAKEGRVCPHLLDHSWLKRYRFSCRTAHRDKGDTSTQIRICDVFLGGRSARALSGVQSLRPGMAFSSRTLSAQLTHTSIQKRVQDIVKDPSKDDQMVDRLLEFKSFTDTVLNEAFVDPSTNQTNQDFAYALIDAFAKGFKIRRNKPAELIAKHVDRLMRHGQRGMSDEAFEALLDAALALYRFTDDKDVFRTFYHRALAKRLLLERSASDDFEKAMLKKLKESMWCDRNFLFFVFVLIVVFADYDPEFGMGDHMFNDLALSRDIMREYHSRIADDSPAQHLSVMVLQRSVWPFVARKKDVDLPPSVSDDGVAECVRMNSGL